MDKPQGWTSHDVVGRMRRLAGTRKVGHAGTLDPMATGVLVVGINKATRLLTYIVGTSKTYTATIRLGQSTVTDDAEGDVIATAGTSGVSEQGIHDGVAALTGDIQQVPSSVSAIKVN
ncbi:MAG: tRNA pseudouridine(55) synthase TruB, partial [Arthrobacter sp.]|nr:tRNA pseudouridine(55) synthase TruB [Arthrobacter sp.]